MKDQCFDAHQQYRGWCLYVTAEKEGPSAFGSSQGGVVPKLEYRGIVSLLMEPCYRFPVSCRIQNTLSCPALETPRQLTDGPVHQTIQEGLARKRYQSATEGFHWRKLDTPTPFHPQYTYLREALYNARKYYRTSPQDPTEVVLNAD